MDYKTYLKYVEIGRRWVEKYLSELMHREVHQTALYHHGIKGQKWGVRRTPEELGHKKKVAVSSKSDILRKKPQSNTEAAVAKQRTPALRKGIRSLEKRIAEHKMKIANPAQYYSDWNMMDEDKKEGAICHWKKEIKTFEESIETRIKELKKRGEYDE